MQAITPCGARFVLRFVQSPLISTCVYTHAAPEPIEYQK
ncbi:hypothetical protein EV675_0157 [Pigmentiphaga kullae]|uniref:Uncharacterized protein n=1 Tax=Pigmentiphaga kullae TaxID=151784 RepID=A0A4Q7NGU4_9BURK|nr:hypothetical protein EV675_0157 [Pigmentiphaga kullae]